MGRGTRAAFRLDLVLIPVVEKVVACVLGEVFEAEDLLTVEARTLHHTVVFEFVRRDDGAAGRTGVGDDAHR